jgi:hypothetical protein
MKRPALTVAAVVAAAVAVISLTATAAVQPYANSLVAKVWVIPSDDYQHGDDAIFPESALLHDRADLGFAFSGGGTRSASATLGQLRALQKMGWLSRAKYITAVSGGSWAALPYTYWKKPVDELLGQYETPHSLELGDVIAKPNGRLADVIAHSGILGPGLREVAGEIHARELTEDANTARTKLLDIFEKGRREPDREN